MKLAGTSAAPSTGSALAADRTRDAVARLILERGPQSAADLADALELSPAAIRRHLDALVAEGLLCEGRPRQSPQRGRGRPARSYALTDAGRNAFPHGYDDLATTALRYLLDTGGEAAVKAFADHRAGALADLLRDEVAAVGPDASSATRAEAMAGSLSAHGYAATTETAAAGTQICQHHCPVAHVAAEFPQLCEAETRAFENVLGTYVQRLATIAHGDGVCTTHVPAPHNAAPIAPKISPEESL
ncbi:metalloregulator ArsR/SmtB family transcription factor [Jatrophihabitans sp.]|uniref:helix-turn-helix transcriptional regulator n=1 Tax=Jatrophihabitans sp. TaxID=1932789 RepID=UPI0030C6EEDA|nr:transcriptional regulator [Jatrophihabitans sp.]